MAPSSTDFYLATLCGRYEGLLSYDQIAKISHTVILIAGCGVGSAIAEEAVRMGFCNLILVDGDNVAPHNMGRQRYSNQDLDINKALALRQRLLQINPEATIDARPIFVDAENVGELMSGVDIVIDAIDPDSPLAIIAMHREARKRGIPVILPADVGWGGKVFVFGKTSIKYEEMLGLDSDQPLNEIDEQMVKVKTWEYLHGIAPEYVREILEKIAAGEIEHYPQPSSAACICAGICVVVLKSLILGEELAYAPEGLSFDPGLMIQGRSLDG